MSGASFLVYARQCRTPRVGGRATGIFGGDRVEETDRKARSSSGSDVVGKRPHDLLRDSRADPRPQYR